jgi:DNA-binding PadR family transcriptional regulator
MVIALDKTEAQIIAKMNERVIKNFLDLIVMNELKNGPSSGYDVISYIHNKYQLLISSGTIYSLLYSLERSSLIEGIWNERKRTYQLTKRGQHVLETMLTVNPEIKNFACSFLKIQ